MKQCAIVISSRTFRIKLFVLAALTLLIAFPVHAQIDPPPGNEPPVGSVNDDDDPVNGRFTFDYGWTNVRPFALNQYLFGYKGGFDHLYAIGMTEGYGNDATYDGGHSMFAYDLAWSFHKFQACEKVVSSNNLETHFTLKGWELMTSAYGLAFSPIDAVTLTGGIGFYWGNLKLQRWSEADNTGTTKYTNPFVAPMGRLELRFNFWVFTIGGRFSYRYDISNDIWKRKNNGMESLPGYKFSETQCLLFIGFRIVTD